MDRRCERAMSDIKILQVNIQGMLLDKANHFCEMIQEKIGEEIIIIPCMGDSGKITVINGADIVYLPKGKKITGDDLYSAVIELEGLQEENQSLKEQISELNEQLLDEYNKYWDDIKEDD